MRGSVLALLVLAVAACGELPDAQSAGDYAVTSSGLNPPKCPDDQLDEGGNPTQPTCSGDAAVQSSCFVPLGGPDLRREIAQTFRVNQEGNPGILRMWVRRLQELPTDPEEAASLHIGIYEIPDDQPEDFVPTDGRDSGLMIAEGFVPRSRLEDATKGYALDVDVAAAIPLFSDGSVYLYPEKRYALIISVPEGERMSFGIGCHETTGGVNVYRDGQAFTRQQRKLSEGAEGEIIYTQQNFVADTRDIAFSFSIGDGCIEDRKIDCGIGACWRQVDQCVDGDFNECVPGDPTAEVCDAIDNDCNGITDDIDAWTDEEGADWPGLGRTSCGVGECFRTFDNCVDGNAIGTTYNCAPGSPAEESCDNKDNDCNGITDDEHDWIDGGGNVWPGLGTNDVGVGVCRVTQEACIAGEWTITTPAMGNASSVEVCNGINDTCEGDVGDFDLDSAGNKLTQPFWPYDASKRNKGICKDGTQTCANTESPWGERGETYLPQSPVWEVTTAAIPPGTESCNGKDDDCDGTVDNNVPPRACYTGPPGTNGVGECHGGMETCVVGGTGTWGSCVGQVTPQPTEICNGKDDNCNGTTDEGQPVIVCGTGVCQIPMGSCTGVGGIKDCAGLGVPLGDVTKKSTEVCDNLDNDCDGTTDIDPNTNYPIQRACYSPGLGHATRNVGRCKDGIQTCAAGSFGTTCPGEFTPIGETCNNLDDNCDGQIDENPTTLCARTANVATTTCSAGNCQVVTCNANTYNIDGNYANGCECVIPNPRPAACSASIPAIATLYEGGTATFSNKIPDANNRDWIRVDFPSQLKYRQRQAGNAVISLSTASVSAGYRMNVRSSTCTGTSCTAVANWQFLDNVSDTGSGFTTRPTAWPTSVYVEVYRTGGLNCSDYTLNISRAIW